MPNSIDFKNYCKKCNYETSCCKSGKYELIGAPYLTKYDQNELFLIFGDRFNNFINKTVSPSNGRILFYLNTKENGDCIFLENRSCSIYDHRPLDCRFFPLDIHESNDEYFLISYDCCLISDFDLSKLASIVEPMIFKFFDSNELFDYSSLPMGLFDIGKWKVIKKLTL